MASPGEHAWARRARGSSGRWIVASCLMAIAAGSLVGTLVPAGTGWDFANFYDAGRRAASGHLETLYQAGTRIGDEAAAGGMKFWGTPLSAFLYAPLAGLRPRAALIAFKIADVLALFTGLALLFTWLRSFAGDRTLFTSVFMIAVLLYQPFWTIFRVGGQSTPFAFLMLVTALLAHTRGRFAISWACFGVAVLIKPILAPGLGFLLLFSGWRAFRLAVPVGVGLAILSLLVAGWQAHVDFLARIVSGTETISPWWYNSALAEPFYYVPALLGMDPHAAPRAPYDILRWASAAAVIAASVRLVGMGEARALSRPARLHLACLVSIALPILISPIAWEHYLVFLFPLFAFVLAFRPCGGGAAFAIAATAIVLALGQNLIVILALADAIGHDEGVLGFGVSVLKSAPCWLAAWLLWRHRQDLVAAHAAIPVGAPA